MAGLGRAAAFGRGRPPTDYPSNPRPSAALPRSAGGSNHHKPYGVPRRRGLDVYVPRPIAIALGKLCGSGPSERLSGHVREPMRPKRAQTHSVLTLTPLHAQTQRVFARSPRPSWPRRRGCWARGASCRRARVGGRRWCLSRRAMRRWGGGDDGESSDGRNVVLA
jgi:hypothetical protein